MFDGICVDFTEVSVYNNRLYCCDRAKDPEENIEWEIRELKKKYSPAGFIVILLVIVLSAWTIFNGLNLGIVKIPNVQNGVVLGLDLVGGAEITYEARC